MDNKCPYLLFPLLAVLSSAALIPCGGKERTSRGWPGDTSVCVCVCSCLGPSSPIQHTQAPAQAHDANLSQGSLENQVGRKQTYKWHKTQMFVHSRQASTCTPPCLPSVCRFNVSYFTPTLCSLTGSMLHTHTAQFHTHIAQLHVQHAAPPPLPVPWPPPH